MLRGRLAGVSLGVVLWGWAAGDALADNEGIGQLLTTIKAVDVEGKGHRPATNAWAELTLGADADDLPTILTALDSAKPLAANWLRAAVDAIAERQVQRGGELPTAALEKFLNDKKHNPRARRLAYEWIVRADPSASDRLIPSMLDDPALELRRDAVARVIVEADTAAKEQKSDAALAAYRKALDAARDIDQVKVVTTALAKLGQPVDMPRHYGFLMDWKLIGPFDNIKGKGFDTAFPPEEAIDPAGSYDGSAGKVSWAAHHTDDEAGAVDLNKAIGKHMGAAAYAMAEFLSDRAQPCELRVGSGNAVKIWLNGKLLASAEAYHANDIMDQYVGRGELKQGRNVILIKVCQNEQTEDWAQDWKFQLRVCDPLGKAILSTDRPATRTPVAATTADAKE